MFPFRRSKGPHPDRQYLSAAGLSIVYAVLSAVALFAGRIIARFSFRLGQRYRVIHIAAIGVAVVFLPLTTTRDVHGTALRGDMGRNCR